MNALFPYLLFIAMFLLGILGFASFDTFKNFTSSHSDRSLYFLIHILAASLAYLSFAFSFVAGLVYLYQDRQLKRRELGRGFLSLPPLETVERLVFRSLLVGLPLLTVALLSGFVWLKNEFGTFWLWNSKILSSVFAWVVYMALFYFHYISEIRGRRMVILSVLAFSLILFAFFGMSLFDSQIKMYAHH